MLTKDRPEQQRQPEMRELTKRDGRYVPIRTDPENDVSQIHTNEEMPQCENSKMILRL